MAAKPEQYVLDACALLRVAQQEPGADAVAKYLYEAQAGHCTVYLHQINLGEVVYTVGKKYGWAKAQATRDSISLLPIKLVEFEDDLFWRAVELKAQYPISYADAFAAALAMSLKATLLSTDSEFSALKGKLQVIAV